MGRNIYCSFWLCPHCREEPNLWIQTGWRKNPVLRQERVPSRHPASYDDAQQLGGWRQRRGCVHTSEHDKHRDGTPEFFQRKVQLQILISHKNSGISAWNAAEMNSQLSNTMKPGNRYKFRAYGWMPPIACFRVRHSSFSCTKHPFIRMKQNLVHLRRQNSWRRKANRIFCIQKPASVWYS